MCKSDELDISLNMFLQLNYLLLAKNMFQLYTNHLQDKILS